MNNNIYTIDEIKINLEKILKDTAVIKVILFGSYAKGNATTTSDIDIIIDSNEKIMGFKLFSLISKIEDLFGKDIDAFEKSEIIKGSVIDNEINKTGVVVYEK